MSTSLAARPSRRLALLAGTLLAGAVGVVVVASLAGGGRDRPSHPGDDIGGHSDATALAAIVETAVRESGDDGQAPSSDVACAAEARATYGQGLGPLVHAAGLRWQGRAAVLLTYRLQTTEGSGLDHRAFVLSRDGCQLLVVQTL